MAKRVAGTDWSGVTRLIERTSAAAGFPATVRIETRLEHHSPGLYHDNYFLAVGERELVLRMAKRYRPVAVAARDWIAAHLPARPAALHGDLLPQNLLWDLLVPVASR